MTLPALPRLIHGICAWSVFCLILWAVLTIVFGIADKLIGHASTMMATHTYTSELEERYLNAVTAREREARAIELRISPASIQASDSGAIQYLREIADETSQRLQRAGLTEITRAPTLATLISPTVRRHALTVTWTGNEMDLAAAITTLAEPDVDVQQLSVTRSPADYTAISVAVTFVSFETIAEAGDETAG